MIVEMPDTGFNTLEVLAVKADQDESHPIEIRLWTRSNAYDKASLTVGEAKDFAEKLKIALQFSTGSEEVYAGNVQLTK